MQVNNRVLSLKEFSDRLAHSLNSYDSLAAKDPLNVQRNKEDILKKFLLLSLIQDYAESEKINISSDEVDGEINSVRKSYPDDTAFRQRLVLENVALSDWREEVKQSLLKKKVMDKISESIEAPKSEEVKKFYDSHIERYQHKERVYVRQIVTDDLTKAKAIQSEIKKHEFAELATKYSVAPEAVRGGLIGWVEKGSVDVFDKAFALQVGAVSPILESTYGFHIFKVEKRSPPGYASLEEVQKQIVQELRGQKQQALFAIWLDKQIRASRVYKDQELVKSLVVETKGSM